MKQNTVYTIFNIVIFSFIALPWAYAQDQKQFVPDEFTYKGVAYRYDPYWQHEEQLIEGNVDPDQDQELIVAFGGVSKSGDQSKIGYFWQIYDQRGTDYRLLKTFWANDYPSKIELHDFDKDGVSEIIVYGTSSIYKNNVYVYQWRRGVIKQIFGQATVYGVYVELNRQPPLIEIGAPNWRGIKEREKVEIGWHYMAEPLREIYVWDGKTFSYDAQLSTAEASFRVQTIEKVASYRHQLFDKNSISDPAIQDKSNFEHLVVYLNNRKFYYVMPSEENDIDLLKQSLKAGQKIKMQLLEEPRYAFTVLFDEEIKFIGKHDASLDGENPVFIFK